jgi:hypothetical protein
MHQARLSARLSWNIGDETGHIHMKYVLTLELSKSVFKFELAQMV